MPVGHPKPPRARPRGPFSARHSGIATTTLRGIFRRHGTRADEVIGDGALGEDFGAGLSERELLYFIEHEWARTADDVLWRRTKCGLLMTDAQRQRVKQVVGP
jgi:glycerol-3-phosphate dehydrogenase